MKKLNLNIQGARGICTLMVFFGHATGAYNIPWLQNHMNNPLRLLLDGHAAVIFFFVLSGYFYYTDKCITIKQYIYIIIKRVIRLIPSYWVSIIIGALRCNYYLKYGISQDNNVSHWFASFWNEPVTWSRFLNEAKVVFRHAPSNEFINPNSWYLKVDFKMMVIIPVVIFLSNKTYWWLSGILIFLSVMTTTQCWVAIFLMGATFHRYQERLFVTIGKHSWFLGVLSVVGVILWDVQTWSGINTNIASNMYRMEIIQAVGVILLLAVLLFLSDLPILTSRVLLFMGRISYEFYIIHFLFLAGVMPFISNTWMYIFVCFIGSLLSAVLLHNGSEWVTFKVLNMNIVAWLKGPK